MREDFVDAMGLNKIAGFASIPGISAATRLFYELIGDDDGVLGCMLPRLPRRLSKKPAVVYPDRTPEKEDGGSRVEVGRMEFYASAC